MLKKTIKFVNFEGDEVTQDFYFNLTKAELVELASELPNFDIEAYLTRLAETNDQKAMLAFLKGLIARSYGKRDENEFVKSVNQTSTFLASEAYSELLFEMAENLDMAVSFFNGVMPQSMMKEISTEEVKQKARELGQPVSEEKVELPKDIQEEQPKSEENRVEELEAELKRLRGE
jgi:hypothetical protein